MDVSNQPLPEYLVKMIPDETSPQQLTTLREKILHTLLHLRANQIETLDFEGLTQDILLECWRLKRPVTVHHIQLRFKSARRDAILYVKRLSEAARADVHADTESFTAHDTLTALMQLAALTFNELTVIHEVYFSGRTLETARLRIGVNYNTAQGLLASALTKFRTAARVLKGREDESEL